MRLANQPWRRRAPAYAEVSVVVVLAISIHHWASAGGGSPVADTPVSSIAVATLHLHHRAMGLPAACVCHIVVAVRVL